MYAFPLFFQNTLLNIVSSAVVAPKVACDMLGQIMKKLHLAFFAGLFLLALSPLKAHALTGNEYAMSYQPDATILCAPTWQTCFSGGNSMLSINLGLGSNLGNGTLKSITIAKDENSPFVSQPWILQLECFTDSSYSTHCSDWLQPNAYNGNVSYVAAEFTTATADNKFWTADFTNSSHESNFGGTSPVTFNPTYYYRLIINDNGWGIGAYGSQTLGLPYYAINGLTL